MQADNYKYKPDPQFTDKSWVAMRELLDKEMPVEKKKRKGFFWIFLFLVIGIAGAFLMFYPENNENVEKKDSAASNSLKVCTSRTISMKLP